MYFEGRIETTVRYGGNLKVCLLYEYDVAKELRPFREAGRTLLPSVLRPSGGAFRSEL